MQLFSLDKSVRDDGSKKLSKMGEEGVKGVHEGAQNAENSAPQTGQNTS